MEIIARIQNDYNSKFGVPRQSGLVSGDRSVIVFEEKFRVAEALRGIEMYSHLWLLWEFSECAGKEWSPTVRPPRLGGNKRMGVFATRSPFRPNSIGLSCVKLVSVQKTENEGTVLVVEGADLMNGTPIIDIKPYLPYADSHPEASNGFALTERKLLNVVIPDEFKALFPPKKLDSLTAVLEQDPRPQYIDDGERIYGMTYAGTEIRFTVCNDTLTVVEIKIE